MDKFVLDWESVDRITLQCLSEHRDYLKESLEKHNKDEYLQPEDASRDYEMIYHITEVIKYFGGD